MRAIARSRARLAFASVVVLSVAGIGCSRKAARGPTPEEQGYLPSDFRAHVEYVTQGIVDWGNHRYLCQVSVPVVDKTTAGEPVSRLVAESRAYDAAGAIAARVAMNLASGLRVDARDTLSNIAEDNATLRVWGHVSGRELVKKGRKLNGDMEFLFQIPMVGVNGVISKLYSRAAGHVSRRGGGRVAEPWLAVRAIELRGDLEAYVPDPVRDVTRSFAAAGPDAWDIDLQLVRPKHHGGLASSAVVIDARGTGLHAALFPVIRDETGAFVYGAAKAHEAAVVYGGLVQYVEMPASGSLSPGTVPGGGVEGRKVVVVARAVSGPLKADIVVSAADAGRIRAESRSLREARVLVVMDGASR